MTGEAAARRRRSSRRWWVAALAIVVVVGTLVVLGANRPADPYFLDGPSVSFRITGPSRAEATGAEGCALLADTSEQHAQGLMHRTDLGGRDGMLFRFPDDVTAAFYMKDTPMPLSIAWFEADGDFVSATDMEPCLGGGSCPTYAAAGPYRYALEVPQGRLPELGAVPGSRLTVGGPCG